MRLLECFEVYKDSQIINLIGGKIVKIKYRGGSSKIGVVTNFINAAVSDDSQRTIVGITIDKSDDIIVSPATIDNISILN